MTTREYHSTTRRGHARSSIVSASAGIAQSDLKFHGAELDHVVLYLDAAFVLGAAYTGISRDRCTKGFVIGRTDSVGFVI